MGKWCPLFGALPDCKEWDGITERCITIIEDARCLVGGFEYLPGLNCPDPDRVEAHTGFPSAWIKSARLLCDDSCFILFDAQHMQGSLGERLLLFDGTGHEYDAVILGHDRESVLLEITGKKIIMEKNIKGTRDDHIKNALKRFPLHANHFQYLQIKIKSDSSRIEILSGARKGEGGTIQSLFEIFTPVDVDLAIADRAGEYLMKFRKSNALSIGDAMIAA